MMKKITVWTSGPEKVTDLLMSAECGICPESHWLHPKTRIKELIGYIKRHDRLDILTWDELTMLIVMAASDEGIAEVEVKYWEADKDEPTAIPMIDGALKLWPDPSGFHNERREVLFGKGVFDGDDND